MLDLLRSGAVVSGFFIRRCYPLRRRVDRGLPPNAEGSVNSLANKVAIRLVQLHRLNMGCRKRNQRLHSAA